MEDAESSQGSQYGPYQLFMLVLCFYALAVLAAEALLPLNPSTRAILRIADNAVCVLFLLDFAMSLIRAPSKWHYFSRWGWIDLLSSIPAIDAFRVGRAARVMRIFRVLRGVRATKLLATFILDRRAEGAFLAAALVSILLVVFSSVAILQFETVDGANIKSPEDALWWAVVTITTVGYGDRFPVSSEGRVLAAMLMTAGVGLFGTFSGFVASWFLAPSRLERKSELDDIRGELHELRRLLGGRPSNSEL